MTATRASIIVVLLIVGGLAIAPVASTAFVGDLIDTTDGAIESEEPSANETTGTDVSTFMQASAADADETVDTAMFVAAYERGDNETRAEIVNERTTQLEAKLERLEAEREELEERENELNPAARNAKMASLAVRISSLERAINDTEPRAAAVGVDTTTLEELRANAQNLSGPEVAAVARNVSGIEPPRGPPEGVPGAGVGSEHGAGATDGNESVNPGNSGNATDRGPGNETNQNPDRGQGQGQEQKPEKGENTQSPGQGPEKDTNDETQNESNPGSGSPSNESNDDAESDTGTDTDT
ncbi:hypothetical protein OB955_07150 [Halobacteria archaeon AArc-m2/3/4]|uniref:DUF5667 domain-containing protein n=1 Tax=Natronoglomus mannanivorans TaxID=2979990 RepID=A0ABT2QC60_9EURY|nr:hypothetical protein [Halobacteria archaeon AArc-m2/3/4]